MKRLFMAFLLSSCFHAYASCREPVLVVFWNIENFFDYTDGGCGKSDKEFSSAGSRNWTRKRFYAKCDAIAKSMMWICDTYGRMPDVIGLAEVENKGVLWKLMDHTLLRKYDYGIVHYDSHDRRGIDVALLYRKSSFSLVSSFARRPEYEGKALDTRDILHVSLMDEGGMVTDMIVNHHPSKYGGEAASAKRRYAVMSTLAEMCASLLQKGSDRIVVMGDFNDSPDAGQFGMLEGMVVNKATGNYERHGGTIRYRGKWELIDMFLVSPGLDSCSEMHIADIPFLMTYDRTYPGEKPLRTYTGPKYTGGVSDHCPILLEIVM